MRSEALSWGALLIVVLLLLVYGLQNYTALLNADSYSYLIYARSLSRGTFFGNYPLWDVFKQYWPKKTRVNLHSAQRHMINGKICYGIDAGYPLLLSGPIKLFGFNSVYFVNPILLLILVLIYFLLLRLVFSRRADRNAIALLSVLILLLIPSHRLLLSSNKIMRDIPPLTFLMISFYFLTLYCKKKVANPISLFISALFLVLASLVRLNYLVSVVPFYLYLIISLGKKKLRLGKIFLLIIITFLGLTVLVVPILVIDIRVNKNILFTLRVIKNFLPFVSGSAYKLFSLAYIRKSGIWYLGYLTRTYSPILIILFFIGLIAGRRNRVIALLLCPSLILQFTLFAVFKYKHPRYLLPIYPVLSCLISFGIMTVLERVDSLKNILKKRIPKFSIPILLLMIIGGCLFIYEVIFRLLVARSHLRVQDLVIIVVALALLSCGGYLRKFLNCKKLFLVFIAGTFVLFFLRIFPSLVSSDNFKLSDVNRLKREFEKYTPPGSLVLSARYLKQNIDMYTHCFSLNPYQLALPWGLTVEQALKVVMDSGINVFGVDNKGFRDAGKFLPVLEEYFEIVPLTHWRSEELNLHQKYFSERPELNLYRVLPWREKQVFLTLEPAPGKDHILIFDARKVWWDANRKEIKAFINDQPLSGAVENNLNYIYLNQEVLKTPQSTFQLVSDQGLPPDIPLRLFQSIDNDFYIDIGKAAAVPDSWFLGEGFFDISRSGRHCTIAGEGRVKIPTFSLPGRVSILKLKVRNNLRKLSPIQLNLEVDEKSISSLTIQAEYQWTVVEAKLPPTHDEVSTSWLKLHSVPLYSTPEVSSALKEKGLLSIDWLAIEWRPESPE